MAVQAYGLKTQIWNNNLRSIGLLVLFPVLLLLLTFGLLVMWMGFTTDLEFGRAILKAEKAMPETIPFAIAAAGTWFAIAFFGHQAMIDLSTKAQSVKPSEEPRAYKLLENLCISRGMTMPRLKVIETNVLNAYASGIRDKNYTVTLTRGLMDGLDDQELEAVIAHELSHIQNKDVRLMIIAVVFVGIFSFFGEGVVRYMMRINMPRSTTHRRSGGGNAGALILFAIIIIAVAYFLAILIRFSLSRKREYMADAGAVELTKNPDAMIRALEKISGRAELKHVPADVREMAFENPRKGFAGVFATHPPIEKRIAALVKFAGGRENTQSIPARSVYAEADKPKTSKEKPKWGPWSPKD